MTTDLLHPLYPVLSLSKARIGGIGVLGHQGQDVVSMGKGFQLRRGFFKGAKGAGHGKS